MSQSSTNNYIHLIWSTKHRQPFITEDIEGELFRYMAKVAGEYGYLPIAVGGYRDHVHLLCRNQFTHLQPEVVSKVKSSSSKWIKQKSSKFNAFYWQNGYGSFSVEPNNVSRVQSYIVNQKSHHQKRSFKEGYLLILKKYQVEFDEKYLWG
ncbi:MAG TPA: IS200/IS605 family transposase [Cytophagales bacterium]|nr:IS200/IS605 family transposase [Cytophagales bacterium]HAA21644.1 IS200/IS605 family transposase [Cytophagales bacterium]HAP60436.1 IS200/IS605 family transposase [Cytophagales bacterium]